MRMPLPLFFLRILLVFALASAAHAKAQCRLVQQMKANSAGNDSGTATPTATGTATEAGTSPSASATPFSYGKDTIRGVNLGGWFVLEPWITPSIFENTDNADIIDEYTFGQMQDHDHALNVLQNHWDTWITEDDFAAIKAAGLNHVRMQVGYWSVPITSADTNYTTSVDPYIPGAWPYLLRALGWAKDHSLHVILDLHGAPGSQNGYDNSGRRGSAGWAQGNNVARTVDIVRFIADQIGGMIDVLELLNEPGGWQSDIANVISNFYLDGYKAVRDAAGDSLKVMIGDAFLGVGSWDGFLMPPDAQGVLMDYHEYQIFNYDQIEMSQDEHINYSCQVLETLSNYAKSNLYTVSGEWSTAITDCAKWLNGRGVGARWDGTWQANQPTFGSCDGYTGDSSTWSDDYKKFLRKYFESQIAIGEAVQGWTFWTWKAENADDWSYQKGVEGGWIPTDPTDRLYPDICSTSASNS
ncbi:glycoside hydrolase [Daedaleopsis nitida]|nr:glycoside hydrolase [Daedaleopsis nitida]